MSCTDLFRVLTTFYGCFPCKIFKNMHAQLQIWFGKEVKLIAIFKKQYASNEQASGFCLSVEQFFFLVKTNGIEHINTHWLNTLNQAKFHGSNLKIGCYVGFFEVFLLLFIVCYCCKECT